MISKNRIKLIRSLKLKKNRDEARLFVVEGTRTIEEMLGAYECESLYCTAAWLRDYGVTIPDKVKPVIITYSDIEQISFMKTPQEVLAVMHIPPTPPISDITSVTTTQLCVALDGVQDPGNLGTILRLSDWFGITTVFASEDTADAFSPKCVQAAMGALARVNVYYGNLPTLFEKMPNEVAIYGTTLDGQNMYEMECIDNTGIVVLGNEGNGISHEVEQYLTRKLFIPSYPQGCERVESLNVAMAGAIVLSEIRRRAQTH